jgi:hypothetical protein
MKTEKSQTQPQTRKREFADQIQIPAIRSDTYKTEFGYYGVFNKHQSRINAGPSKTLIRSHSQSTRNLRKNKSAELGVRKAKLYYKNQKDLKGAFQSGLK